MEQPITTQDSRPSKEGFPRRFFTAAFVISLLTTLFSGWHSWQLHQHYEEVSKRHVAISESASRILLLDEVLTMSARMAAATGDFSYETRYDHFEPLLTEEINTLSVLLPQAGVEESARSTDEANLALVRIERQAFSLTRQGKQREAMDLLTGDDYTKLKTVYAEGMDKTIKAVDRLMQDENRQSHILSIKLSTASIASVLVLLLTWLFAFRSTHSWEAERKVMEQQIRDQAFHDALTKLPNRRMLIDRLGQAMASSKRTGLYGALMYLDLDNFKPLNDAHGHGAGDLLLIEVAQRITRCVREMDTVARIGGDEFVVILRELDEDGANSAELAGIVAEKIRSSLAECYRLTVHRQGKADAIVEHHCSSSIGVTLFIDHEASGEEVIKQADMAMLQAKENGRNTIRFA